MKYRFAGRERLLALDLYPEVSLAEARRHRNAARALLRDGIDPMAAKTYRKAEYVLDTYLIPTLRRRSITTMKSKDAADALAGIAAKAPALAAKARQYLGGIVNYAIREELRDDG
ncbi:integrase arm-type DNA-binding domain-containing protein [Steroidobacter denitrificans]|nr:integrase arm-type DNA-binding domain-containing protein [Steroidobacter denitrificans]